MASKKWLSALALVVIGSAACTASEPSSEATGSTASAQVAPLACTPLLGTTAAATAATTAATLPFLSCFGDTTAASVQASIMAQMQAAFATVALAPDFTANQVTITSQAQEFSSLFGAQIVVPLLPSGIFTAAVPITVGSLAPNLALTANIFGVVPGVITPFATGAPIAATNAANAGLAAANAAANVAATTSTISATMPLTFFITSPAMTSPALTTANVTAASLATQQLACNGAFMLGCN